MTDADALLAAVLAEPDDDLPRLVYADWLDENGRPERAEFVRVQVELARFPDRYFVPWTFPVVRTREEAQREAREYTGWTARVDELRAREQTLLALHREAWLAPLKQKGEPFQAVGTHGGFRRGFVEVVWMPASWFVLRAEALFRRVPARELRVTQPTLGSHLAELLACPLLPRLNMLDVSGLGWGDNTAAILADAPAIASLKAVRLRNCDLTDAAAFRLARVGPGWQPGELDVSHNPLGPAGVAALRDRFGAAVVWSGPG
jgi:uncharacterized protein (TIGR02996 family)